MEDTSGHVGDVFDVIVDVSDESGLQSLEVTKDVGGVEDPDFTQTFTLQGTSDTETVEVPLEAEDVGQTVTITFVATDVEGQSSDEILNIEVLPTRIYSEVLLFAPTQNLESETFFNYVDGDTYSVDEVNTTTESISQNILFGYYYGAGTLNNEASLSSPASYPSTVLDLSTYGWNTLNQTQLKLTDITEAELLENEDDPQFISDAFDNAPFGGSEQQVTNLAVGDIVAFRATVDQNQIDGLIRVSDLQPGFDADDFIELEVIVSE